VCVCVCVCVCGHMHTLTETALSIRPSGCPPDSLRAKPFQRVEERTSLDSWALCCLPVLIRIISSLQGPHISLGPVPLLLIGTGPPRALSLNLELLLSPECHNLPGASLVVISVPLAQYKPKRISQIQAHSPSMCLFLGLCLWVVGCVGGGKVEPLGSHSSGRPLHLSTVN
jgi:hypothetical protein